MFQEKRTSILKELEREAKRYPNQIITPTQEEKDIMGIASIEKDGGNIAFELISNKEYKALGLYLSYLHPEVNLEG